ncbi:MAG TPA: methylated-DNA--[protein]-cysteine S-methyltransferase [Actinomycetota bacterium]
MAHESSTLWRTTTETPLGPYTIFLSDAGVVRTHFDEEGGPDADMDAVEDRRRTAPIRREVDAYFRGALRTFETPADLSAVGEGFTRRVLEMVRTIPYGELWTYGDVAAAAGAARAGRAAGSALARSPIELFVPCHRVVRAGPSLGSYGRHDDRRRFLLQLEKALPGPSLLP